MRKLIIENDIHSAKRLVRLLEMLEEGNDITLCTNIEEGLRKIYILDPEIVFMEVEHKGMSGFDMFRKLQGTKYNPTIIIISGFDLYALKAYKFGVFEYLLKPLDIDELSRTLERYKKTRRNRKVHSDNIEISNQFKTPLKQYLEFFNDYAKKVKGENLEIEIINSANGIEIVYLSNNNFERELTRQLLSEYIQLIKEDINHLEIDLSIKLDENQRDFFIIELKNEILQLKNKIEIKNLEIKFLNKEIDSIRYFLTPPNPNNLEIHVNSNTTINNQIVNRVVLTELNNLYSIIETIKSQPKIISDLEIIDEINDLESEAGDAKITPNEHNSRKLLNNLKSFFSKFRKNISRLKEYSEDSVWIVEKINSLISIYNKLAVYFDDIPFVK